MRLVGGRAAGPQLLQREHQLDRVEQACDARQLGRRQPAGEPHELGPGHVDVDEHPRDLAVRERHRLGCDLEVEPVGDEEAVDHVELGLGPPVQPHDAAVLDDELRLGIVRPVHRDEPELRQRAHEQLAPELLLRARGEAAGPRGVSHRRAPAPRRPRRPRGRTRPCAGHPTLEPARPLLELGCGRAARSQRRVDLEEPVVGDAAQLGGTIEVVGELQAAGRARDRSLAARAVAAVARTSAATRLPARAASRVTSSSERPDGVSTRSGRREPSG